MKREIKFRAWCRDGEWEENQDKRKFEMIESDELQTDSIRFSLLKDFLTDIEDDCYWMQFTGLKDKNGKEIYEGDIIKVTRDFTEPWVKSIKGIVKFSDASFYIKTSYGGHYRWMDYELEVIGNIHENPEII